MDNIIALLSIQVVRSRLSDNWTLDWTVYNEQFYLLFQYSVMNTKVRTIDGLLLNPLLFINAVLYNTTWFYQDNMVNIL